MNTDFFIFLFYLCQSVSIRDYSISGDIVEVDCLFNALTRWNLAKGE